ncbi:hypothetical protein V6N13_000590 [Hibiscus sabdariffa]
MFCNYVSRHVFQLDELGSEIAQIALPAALALTADPIASLVDTAFIGQIESNDGPCRPKTHGSSFDIDKFEPERRHIPSASSALVIGGILGLLQAIFLISGARPLLNFMGISSFVAATQPINCLAFVFDGVNFGASDFAYSAFSLATMHNKTWTGNRCRNRSQIHSP